MIDVEVIFSEPKVWIDVSLAWLNIVQSWKHQSLNQKSKLKRDILQLYSNFLSKSKMFPRMLCAYQFLLTI